MAKKIVWTGKARADLRAINRDVAIDLLHRLARFLATEKGDVKQLQDVDPVEYRLRLGDYRVRFYDHGEWIEILRVRNRKDAYR